jgi:CBS domain-containing protein
MKKVSDILKRKGNAVTTVTPDTIVIDALRMMAEMNIGSVVVMQDNEFAGIITERDYSRKVILKGKSSDSTKVAEIMSTDYPRIKPNDTIEYCMQQLSEKNIRYLPVFEEQKLSGIISINDVVKEIILSQEETISSLKDYLHTNI